MHGAMRHRYTRAARALLGCAVSGFTLVLVGEVLLYDAYSFTWEWPRNSGVSTSLKILLVSDPHIQCTFSAYEPRLFRWDADRYLRQSYSRAIRRMNPDVVVLLGDIFAEGFKASASEWNDYLKCSKEIFHTPKDTQLIVIPGDNDIGGEGSDRMNEEVNRRYIAEFGPLNSIVKLRNVIFMKVNTPSFINPVPQGVTEAAMRLEVESFLNHAAHNLTRRPAHSPVVLLSHVPVADLAMPEIRRVIVDIVQPNYLFSGHTHRPMTHCHRYVDGVCASHEFTVPTSSYRMGEAFMGLGTAAIDKDGHLDYEVLQLPPRFIVLFCYLLWAVASAVTIVTCFCCRRVLSSRTAGN